MKVYELGIMSSKWQVTAPSLDIATLVIAIYVGSAAPIVCYNDDERSKFSYGTNYTQAEAEAFIKLNVEAIQLSYKTVTEIAP